MKQVVVSLLVGIACVQGRLFKPFFPVRVSNVISYTIQKSLCSDRGSAIVMQDGVAAISQTEESSVRTASRPIHQADACGTEEDTSSLLCARFDAASTMRQECHQLCLDVCQQQPEDNAAADADADADATGLEERYKFAAWAIRNVDQLESVPSIAAMVFKLSSLEALDKYFTDVAIVEFCDRDMGRHPSQSPIYCDDDLEENDMKTCTSIFAYFCTTEAPQKLSAGEKRQFHSDLRSELVSLASQSETILAFFPEAMLKTE